MKIRSIVMNISRRKFLIGAGATGAVIGGGAVLTPMIKRQGELIDGKSRALPVEGTPGPLPKRTDVAIVGGGIIGILTAINLAERGLDVTVLEKGVVAGEQSGRAYGQVISYEVGKEIFPLHHYGQIYWREMNKRIGADSSYRTTGRIAVPSSAESLEKGRAWVKEAQEWAKSSGVPLSTRFIEGEELKQRLAGTSTNYPIAAFEADAGAVDPEIAAPVLAEYAKRIGVKIYTHCAVRGIETEGGVISDVVTEKGAIKASKVVVSAGYWARLFMGNLGVDVPTLSIYLTQSRMRGLKGMPPVNVHMPYGEIGVHFRPQADGSYAVAPRVFTESITKDSFLLSPRFMHVLFSGAELPLRFKVGEDLIHSFETPTSWKLDEITPFEKNRIAAATHSPHDLKQEVQLTREAFPIFKDSEVIEKWGAVVPITDDEIPIISEVPKYPGLVLNVPVGWGMTESPVSSEITADIIMGRTPKFDIKPFSIDRFK